MASFKSQTLRGHGECQGKVGGRAESHMRNAHGTVKELSSCTLVMKVYLNAITCIAQTSSSDIVAHFAFSGIICCLPKQSVFGDMSDSYALDSPAPRTQSQGEMQDASTLKHDVHCYHTQWLMAMQCQQILDCMVRPLIAWQMYMRIEATAHH